MLVGTRNSSSCLHKVYRVFKTLTTLNLPTLYFLLTASACCLSVPLVSCLRSYTYVISRCRKYAPEQAWVSGLDKTMQGCRQLAFSPRLTYTDESADIEVVPESQHQPGVNIDYNLQKQFKISFGQIYLAKPMMTESDGETGTLFPKEARLRNLTYVTTIGLSGRGCGRPNEGAIFAAVDFLAKSRVLPFGGLVISLSSRTALKSGHARPA
eukprot:3375487-Pyramimonas_sp.AAC.3